MFNHLTSGGTVGQYPATGDVETDSDPAEFRAINANPAAKLPVQCNLISATDLLIEYTWPVNQRDLDTGTMFDGHQVGYACGYTGAYMAWSGDDTSAGGSERVTVSLSAALAAGKLTNGTIVSLKAGWFTPAGGSGLATVTVSLLSKATGQRSGSQQLSVVPGSQAGCASTLVASVEILVQGVAGQEAITFAASSQTGAQAYDVVHVPSASI
jgi:hypothetical protein